jgi:hypothetical protein
MFGFKTSTFSLIKPGAAQNYLKASAAAAFACFYKPGLKNRNRLSGSG